MTPVVCVRARSNSAPLRQHESGCPQRRPAVACLVAGGQPAFGAPPAVIPVLPCSGERPAARNG